MDGQVTLEETEAMFAKFTSIVDYLRNALVSNTELAREVQTLKQLVNDMAMKVDQVTSQNSALQEAVNVLTSERDVANRRIAELESENRDLRTRFEQRDNDANHWYTQWGVISEEVAKVKQDRSALEEDHLKLLEEHEKAKDKLKHIQSVFGAAQVMEQENHPVPIVEPIKTDPQPRDPVTQQWQSWKIG